MSGHWIKLNDTRVRCDQGDTGPLEAFTVARCLGNLFDVPSIIDVCACEWAGSAEECGHHWFSRDHSDAEFDVDALIADGEHRLAANDALGEPV